MKKAFMCFSRCSQKKANTNTAFANVFLFFLLAVFASSAWADCPTTVKTVSVAGGSLNCDYSSGVVTLTAKPNDGYLLDGITVVDGNKNAVELSADTRWYSGAGNTVTFTMPSGSVTVTPKFTALNDLSANLSRILELKRYDYFIPEGVTSFKVYDDGGKDGDYSFIYDNIGFFYPPEGYALQVTGTIATDKNSSFSIVAYHCNTCGNEKRSNRYLLHNLASKVDAEPLDIGLHADTGFISIGFHTKAEVSYAGFDLNVKVVKRTDKHSVELISVTEGSIKSDMATAVVGETVTLTAFPNPEYWFKGVEVKSEGKSLTVRDVDFVGNKATFVMPGGDVTVTPLFTKDLSEYFVVVPSGGEKIAEIPAGVTQFKVYDNGGKDLDYTKEDDGKLVLKAPQGKVIQISGNVSVCSEFTTNIDDFYIIRGTDLNGKVLWQTLDDSRLHKFNVENLVVGESALLYFDAAVGQMLKYDIGEGFDFTVTLLDATIKRNVNIASVVGGSVKSDKDKAVAGEIVTLTAAPDADKILSEIIVTDKNGKSVNIEGGNWYMGNTASFIMPDNAVNITPVFTNKWNAEGGLYVNLPQIGIKSVTVPPGIKSFKVYDHGGKNGNYNPQIDGRVMFTAPEGFVFEVSGSMTIDGTDKLFIYESHKEYSSTCIFNSKSAHVEDGIPYSIPTVKSSGEELRIQFLRDLNRHDENAEYPGLDITVKMVPSNTVVLDTLSADYVAQNGDELTGTIDVFKNPYKVSIADGATVVLNGVNIRGETSNENYKWAGLTCEGNCTIVLAEGSDNFVQAFYPWYPGIQVAETGTLTIEGSGKLKAEGSYISYLVLGGAGIGCNANATCGDIVINGGDITAMGSSLAAGIGGGAYGGTGNITINGGSVTAIGGMGGTGIGSGTSIGWAYGNYKVAIGNISITGGTVKAIGGENAAGIGLGDAYSGGEVVGGDITIRGGIVEATGGKRAAGIGIGKNAGGKAVCGAVTITEDVAKLIATKGEDAPYSIGLGVVEKLEDVEGESTVGTITIGSKVTGNIEENPFKYPTYTIVFDANGGRGTMESQVFPIGESLPLNENKFTRSGYMFASWNTKAAGNGSAFVDGASVTDLANAGKMVTLYAQWTTGKSVALAALTDDYVAKNGDVLTGTLDGSKLPYKISIADGATVKLKDATINGVKSEDAKWAGITCLGNCKIILEGTNSVKGFFDEFPGIYVPVGKTLTIDGTGSLDASSNGWAAGIGGGYIEQGFEDDDRSCGNIVIAGGNVKATGGLDAAGIGGAFRSSCGNITISGGEVDAKGGMNAAGIGLGENVCYSYDGCEEHKTSCGDITITDGVTKVTATKGYGNAPFSIGKGNVDGSRAVSTIGTITIGGKVTSEIRESPYVYIPPVLNITQSATGKTKLALNGNYIGTDPVVIEEDVSVDAVEFNRKFSPDAFSTMTFPFDVETDKLEGLSMVLKFNGLRQKEDKSWSVRMKKFWEKGVTAVQKKLDAYTPYMVLMNDESLAVKGAVTLKKTVEAVSEVDGSEWEFRGTTAYKKWKTGDPELGRVYGFAAESKDGISVGQFVKAGAGAWIPPYRAYLYKKPAASGVRSSIAGGKSFATMNLPDEIDVEIEDDDGDEPKTTVVGKFNTRTGEFRMNSGAARTFDVKGRNVGDKANKARGTYYKKDVK